mmetsp:Transcript_18879/g.40665  ORF Transcript_18879/g.40665 Transcript_18879/m.40665 type:complete len:135 (+) Transcript_18879:497-901(+)
MVEGDRISGMDTRYSGSHLLTTNKQPSISSGPHHQQPLAPHDGIMQKVQKASYACEHKANTHASLQQPSTDSTCTLRPKTRHTLHCCMNPANSLQNTHTLVHNVHRHTAPGLTGLHPTAAMTARELLAKMQARW